MVKCPLQLGMMHELEAANVQYISKGKDVVHPNVSGQKQ